MKPVLTFGWSTIGPLAMLLAFSGSAGADDSPGVIMKIVADTPVPQPAATGDATRPAGNAMNEQNSALPPATEAANPPSGGGDMSRDESSASVANSSTPNVIGDMGGGPNFKSVLQLPPYLGPTQNGSILFSNINPVYNKISESTANPIQFNVQNYSIVTPQGNVAATPSLSGSGTTYFSTLSATSTYSLSQVQNISLTNSDSAAQMQMAKSVSSSLALPKGSTVHILGDPPTASLTYADSRAGVSYPRVVSPNDAFLITQPYSYQSLVTPAPIAINIPSPSGGLIGRQRIADNENVMPVDRLFCDYSYFHDAYLATAADASRFVPGFEKTFFNGQASLEARFPMGILENNNVLVDQSSYGNTGQFGDIELIFKAIALEVEKCTVCAGLGVTLPTAPDVTVGYSNGTPLAKIANRSAHLLPFVGVLVRPDEDWFAQAFLEVDVAANGDPTYANVSGNGLTSVGEIYDQTLLMVDASLGRWIYRNPERSFSALAAVVEAHYTGAVNAPAGAAAGGFLIGSNVGPYNVLDLTFGLHAVVNKTTFTVGYATPVSQDRAFEGELRCFVNRTF